jgi:hypothetical protein
VTCRLAENTFYEYYMASGGDSSRQASIRAWSTGQQRYYDEYCANAGDYVDCSLNNGHEIRLAASGLALYSDRQAAKYAAAADIGPNG